MKYHIDQLKNFGFIDEVTVGLPGINGKMSEVNAAFGLVQLKHMEVALAGRQRADRIYRSHLHGIKGIRCLENSGEKVSNYSYFPIMVREEYPLTRDELYQRLKENNIFARRYFYPLISEFPTYKNFSSSNPSMLEVAAKASLEVLCLPLFPSLAEDDQLRIISLIKNV